MAGSQKNTEGNLQDGGHFPAGKLKDLFRRIKSIRHIKTVAVIVLIAAMVAIYFAPTAGKDEKQQNREKAAEATSAEKTDNELLEDILSGIQGVGKVRVMITYDSSPETVAAYSSQTEKSVTTENDGNGGTRQSETVTENRQPVTVGSGGEENAVSLKEVQPDIKGVIVVAQGADSLQVRLNLLKAVETVLQLEPSQVEIFAMNE